MEYQKHGDTYVVRLSRGEEVVSSIVKLCEAEQVTLAEVSAIGAVDHVELCVYDVDAKKFHTKAFAEPMEVSSFAGTVTEKDGKPYVHVHGTVCNTELAARGGHVLSMVVSATFEMLIRTLPGSVGRRFDPDIGLNLFAF